MNAETLRDLSPDELEAKSQDLREQLLKLRFQKSTGQIESPQMVRAVRKDIARVMTIRREKELGAAAAVEAATAATVEVGSAGEQTNIEQTNIEQMNIEQTNSGTERIEGTS